jgi:hypothetical protein
MDQTAGDPGRGYAKWTSELEAASAAWLPTRLDAAARRETLPRGSSETTSEAPSAATRMIVGERSPAASRSRPRASHTSRVTHRARNHTLTPGAARIRAERATVEAWPPTDAKSRRRPGEEEPGVAGSPRLVNAHAAAVRTMPSRSCPGQRLGRLPAKLNSGAAVDRREVPDTIRAGRSSSGDARVERSLGSGALCIGLADRGDESRLILRRRVA